MGDTKMKNYLTDVAKKIEEQYANFLIGKIDVENIDLYTIIQSILPEYRLYIFSKFCDLLNIQDYNMGLKYAYTKTDGINNRDVKISIDEVLDLFAKIDKKIFMEDDYNQWCNLPEIITIYRGTNKDKISKAISWTLEEKRAIWFYQKYNSKGTVFKAKIKKEDAICLIDETACGEKELIINYNKVYELEELSKNRLNREKKIQYTDNNMYADTDYVIRESRDLLQKLALVGISPDKELAEEIYKTYEQKGRYKSNYIVNFGSDFKIPLSELIKQIEEKKY